MVFGTESRGSRYVTDNHCPHCGDFHMVWKLTYRSLLNACNNCEEYWLSELTTAVDNEKLGERFPEGWGS